MIEIRRINDDTGSDVRLKNDSFPLWGKMIPCYNSDGWSYTVEKFPVEQCSQMCFPDENYSYEEMKKDHIFVGAYDGSKCVGLAVLEKQFFKYLYLSDLKVSREYRSRGIGKQLIQKCADIAEQEKLRGIYLIGQDNNLSACLFYLHSGFRIGGLVTDVYNGTSQEGKSDIYFFLDNP